MSRLEAFAALLGAAALLVLVAALCVVYATTASASYVVGPL